MNNSRKISSYVPHIYRNFLEINVLVAVEDEIFDIAEAEKHKLESSQFVLIADEDGIAKYEDILGIIPNLLTESLEFRRDRIINRISLTTPFTFRFLKNRLDETIGEGKWSAYIDFDNYTLYVESSATDQTWFEEIRITIGNIKPANIVFINKPFITKRLVMSENISYNTYQYNYLLGVSWALGSKPFVNFTDKGVIKLANVSSLKAELFNTVATFTADEITSVLLNDTVVIDAFDLKQASNNIANIEYTVFTGQLNTITNIKLRDSSNNTLSESVVYVPLADDVLMKHTIVVKEGV